MQTYVLYGIVRTSYPRLVDMAPNEAMWHTHLLLKQHTT